MTRLFGCTCNQPERLAHALEPVRTVLVAPAPVARWGLGYVQSGEVLLSRTPRRSVNPVDFYGSFARIQSDYVIGHAASDDHLSGNANTQPFRYRRWLYAQDGELADLAAVQEQLLEKVPGYLRRNIQGRTLGEHLFQIFLAMFESTASLDDVNLPLAESRRALHAAVTLIRGIVPPTPENFGNIITTNSRSLVAARLGRPLYMRNLNVPGLAGERSKAKKGDRESVFRGILVLSSDTPPGQGFEEIPVGSVLLVSRDLRIEVTSLDI